MRDCYDTCAMESEIINGKLFVRANPKNKITGNFLCPKGALLPRWFHSEERLKVPLIRNSPKPGSGFRESTWDESLELVAREIKKVIEKYGEKSVLLYYYYGDRGYVNANFPHRLFNYLNASIVEDVICDRNGEEALREIYGDSQGMDPEDISKEKMIIYWGINAAWTNMHGFYFPKRHGVETWAVDILKSKTVKLADKGIIIRPESDLLLALGIAKVLVEKKLYDEDFVRSNARGFERFAEYLENLEMERISRKTGLSEEKIEEIGVEYGKKKGVIHIGYGFQRTAMGGDAVKAISILPAMVGKLRGFIYSNRILRRELVRAPWLRKKEGYRISQLELAEKIEDGTIKFVFIYGTNPLATLPNQNKLREAILSSDVFIVLHDIFMTDTALFSDVVLPANTFFEREDIADSYYHRYIAINEKITEKYGKSNSEVARLLAKKLGIKKEELYEEDEKIIRSALEDIGVRYEELKREKVIKIPLKEENPKTASGKIEFPIFDSLSPPRRRGLKLISATYLFTISSQYHNTYRYEDTKIYISEKDGKKRGIKSGDRVKVYNEFGSIVTEVKLSEDIPEGVALMYKAFWPSIVGNNVNFLVSDARSEKYRGTTLHSTWVEVEKNDE